MGATAGRRGGSPAQGAPAARKLASPQGRALRLCSEAPTPVGRARASQNLRPIPFPTARRTQAVSIPWPVRSGTRTLPAQSAKSDSTARSFESPLDYKSGEVTLGRQGIALRQPRGAFVDGALAACPEAPQP